MSVGLDRVFYIGKTLNILPLNAFIKVYTCNPLQVPGFSYPYDVLMIIYIEQKVPCTWLAAVLHIAIFFLN